MFTVEDLNERGEGKLPGLLGLEFRDLAEGYIASQLDIRDIHLAPNGYLHAATVVALADTSCGYGCFTNLPEGAETFTTIELKSNFLGTAREGIILCEARLAHGGRTTQVWDATVTGTDGRTIALFRCTQMVLYPR
ncbi:MAG: PaaI family thioesterase [Rubrobacter sp.]